MVIECMGLPGSGKTELIELTERELRRREVDYINVSAKLRHNVLWKLVKMVAGALIYLSADARWLRDRVLKLLQEEKASGGSFGIFENEREVIRKDALYAFCYRRMIRSHKLFLFDEGMAQLLTSFGADHRICDETFRKVVATSQRGIRSARLVIYNRTSAEEALSALSGEKGQNSAAAKLREEDRTEFLREWERCGEVYKKDPQVLELQRTDEKRKKLSRVFGRIRQSLSEPGAGR